MTDVKNIKDIVAENSKAVSNDGFVPVCQVNFMLKIYNCIVDFCV